MAAESSDVRQELDKDKFEKARVIMRVLKRAVAKKYQLISKIKWLTGSNGERILPLLKYTDYTLMPTGQLLDRKISPISGERARGVESNGINQTQLSGVLPLHYGYAWGYANYHKDSVDWKKTEEEEFAYTHRYINHIIVERKANEDTAEATARKILLCRQLNEDRYQREFVATKKIEQFQLIALDDRGFSIFRKQQQVLEAFATKIPDDAKLSHDRTGIKIFQFIISKGWKNLFTERDLKDYLTVYLEKYKDLKGENGIYMSLHEEKLPAQILFLKSFDEQYVAAVEENILKFINYNIEILRRSQRRLLLSINEGPLFIFDHIVRQEVQDLGRMPLLFSTTKGYRPGSISHSTETTHQGEMKLADDIDLIATDDENLPKLKKYLLSNGFRAPLIQVCSAKQIRRYWYGFRHSFYS